MLRSELVEMLSKEIKGLHSLISCAIEARDPDSVLAAVETQKNLVALLEEYDGIRQD